MKRILLLAIAALWLAAPSTASAQSLTKLCFPATGLTATRTSCINVDSSNPLPTTATLNASALSVTVTNTVGAPAIVTCTNCSSTVSGGPFNVTITNTVASPAVISGTALGDPADSAYSGSGNGSSISILKAINTNVQGGSAAFGAAFPSSGIATGWKDSSGNLQPSAASSFSQSITPTLTTSNYTAGNCMGGFQQLTLVNFNGQTGFATNFRISSLAGNTGGVNLYLFDSQPTTSTCSDKGTLSLSATDLDKLLASVQNGTLAAATGTTTPTNISVDFTPPRPFIAGGSISSGVRTVWFALQAATSLTPASTTDIHVRGAAALN